MKCHSYGYATIDVDEFGAIKSIKMKLPSELRIEPKQKQVRKNGYGIKQEGH